MIPTFSNDPLCIAGAKFYAYVQRNIKDLKENMSLDDLLDDYEPVEATNLY